MSRPYVAALLLGVVVLVVMIELLRRRQLREKFAALWIGVAVAIFITAAVPGLLRGMAGLLGFVVPSNLLFLAGGILLTTISVQLSAEIGRLEGESQRLAEELALLRLDVERRLPPEPPTPGAGHPEEP